LGGARIASSIVELSGHIIDSLILLKVLDPIVNLGGDFEILQVQVGHCRTDRSCAQILVETKSSDVLDQILARFRKHGALSLDEGEGSVQLESAPQDGFFPEGFYATTNLATLI
jgi:hypothetical protein